LKNPKPFIGSFNPSDEIRKFKSLLDDGIISQEEFDAKKKQLLGL
jgi:predicted Zn-dependent peptidase